MSDALAAPTILTPHALPMFRELEGPGRGTKRKAEKDRLDPRKSRRPELPVTGPGKGGRVGASATQHVVRNLVRDTTRDEDVCETLFCKTCLFRHRFSLMSLTVADVLLMLTVIALAAGSTIEIRRHGDKRPPLDCR